MISIRKHLERLSREDKVRRAFMDMVQSMLTTTRDHILVTDTEEHAWFCANLDSFQQRLRDDSTPNNVDVVAALVEKTLHDHWTKLSRQTQNREQELKRIIHLLTESAAQLDAENKQFYLQLRTAVQSFQSISQLDDITFLRKKLSEQVMQLQDSVSRQEAVSLTVVSRLQSELDEARKEIAALNQATTTDPLTRLPTRRAAEKAIRYLIDKEQPFSVAMAVIERLDQINLRYGAECGDMVLRRFSGKLREQIPSRAFVCRWGGPAFVFVVEHMPAGELRPMLQKILGGIAAEPIELQTKGSSFLHITSRYAVHQWLAGQTAEKIIGLMNVFCLSQKVDSEDAEPARLTR